MLGYVIDIFSEKSDQARLITIVISAFVAIFVVLLNQWFVSRRAKKDLIIEKIEELYTASNEYISACRELIESTKKRNMIAPGRNYEYPVESVHKLNDSIGKIQMICGLYFKSSYFEPKEYHISHMPILEILHKGKVLFEGDANSAYEDSNIHIAKSRETLDELCKSLMRKYGN